VTILPFGQRRLTGRFGLLKGISPIHVAMSSKTIDQAPQYSVQVRDFKVGSAVVADDFGFHNSTNAKKIEVVDLGDIDELPSQFKGVTKQ
jgi:hypothetical protein